MIEKVTLKNHMEICVVNWHKMCNANMIPNNNKRDCAEDYMCISYIKGAQHDNDGNQAFDSYRKW